MANLLFWRKSKRSADEREVIRIVVRRNPTARGQYTYEMVWQAGPSDVVCMASDLRAAVENIVRPQAGDAE